MKRFLLKILIWICAVSTFCITAISMLDYGFITGKKKVYIEQRANKNLDLMILGSSRAEFIIDPLTLSNEYKIYNCGYSGHGLPSNYFELKILVEKYGYKVKNLLLSTDELNFNGSVGFSRKFRDDFFVDNMNDSEVYEAYKAYRGPAFAYMLKHFPHASIIVYSDFRKLLRNIPSMLTASSEKARKANEASMNMYASNKGFSPILDPHEVINNHIKIPYIIEEDDLHYFFKITEFCKKHKINLAFYRAPILYCENHDSHLFDRFITAYTKANNIPFYDYKCSYQYANKYYDDVHATGPIAHQLSMDLKGKIQSFLAGKRPYQEQKILYAGLSGH